jgi:hypothetical protein
MGLGRMEAPALIRLPDSGDRLYLLRHGRWRLIGSWICIWTRLSSVMPANESSEYYVGTVGIQGYLQRSRETTLDVKDVISNVQLDNSSSCLVDAQSQRHGTSRDIYLPICSNFLDLLQVETACEPWRCCSIERHDSTTTLLEAV